jgi:transcriptional regulator with XRE-family HTH domain
VLLGISEILEDLIALREGLRITQRDLANRMRLPAPNKIQRMEKGTDKLKKLGVEDMALWLEKCNSSMAIYFNQKAAAEELKLMDEDKALLRALHVALRVSKRRETIEHFLKLWTDEDEEFRKAQRQHVKGGGGRKADHISK